MNRFYTHGFIDCVLEILFQCITQKYKHMEVKGGNLVPIAAPDISRKSLEINSKKIVF